MARIKCRYNNPYCLLDRETVMLRNFDCDTTFYCAGYERPENAPPNLVNPTCKYFDMRHGEFEENTAYYSYEDGMLKTRKRRLYDDDIEYLEIDGRVLIDEEAGG